MKKDKLKISEHQLQSVCFNWFRYQYPDYKHLYFAIPNGGARHILVAKKLKAEGVVAGVFDSFLAVAKNGHNGLFIEFKVGNNKLTENQLTFKAGVEAQRYATAVIYDIEDFKNLIKNYLNEKGKEKT